MKVTFPEKQADVAEALIDGKPIQYRIPPVTGTHSQCFGVSDNATRTAQGREIATYAFGALAYRKNEWADQQRIRFPRINYLRVPAVLTMVPNRKEEFGDLAGVMLVDSDLAGEGLAKQTEVPENFTGWKPNASGLMVRDNRIAVPMDKWYFDTWTAKNGAAIALFEEDGAEVLEKAAADSGRNSKPLWKVDINSIKTPEKRVPFVDGYGGAGLGLGCDDGGYYVGYGRDGCAVRVLK